MLSCSGINILFWSVISLISFFLLHMIYINGLYQSPVCDIMLHLLTDNGEEAQEEVISIRSPAPTPQPKTQAHKDTAGQIRVSFMPNL